MKYTILLSALMLTLVGCNTTSYVHTAKDGSTDTFHNTRWLWTNDSIEASLSPTNGVSVKTTKSSTDSAAMAAITQAAVQGAVQGTK